MPRRAARLRCRCRCLTASVSSCFPLSAAQGPGADAADEDAVSLRVRLAELETSNKNLQTQVQELQDQKQKVGVAIVYGVVDGEVASELHISAQSVGLRTPLSPMRLARRAPRAPRPCHTHARERSALPPHPIPCQEEVTVCFPGPMTKDLVMHVEKHFYEMEDSARSSEDHARSVTVLIGFGSKGVGEETMVDHSVLRLTMKRKHLGELATQIAESTTFEVQLRQEMVEDDESNTPKCTGVSYDHLNGLLSARGVPKQSPRAVAVARARA